MRRHELQGRYDDHGCGRLPLDGGRAGSHDGPEAFLRVLKPAASPLRTPGHAAG
ncbi:hypothetical protein [Segatella baroniae]|uniref:hypothetical protein n=1 Tax=Segatella baroniae TaxID=305719 RepID=UPI0012DFC063|nr:hypothetical protein [Segatella baroniae]